MSNAMGKKPNFTPTTVAGEAVGIPSSENSTSLKASRKWFVAYVGTVKEIKDIQLFYLTTTHALVGLCKKLTEGKILEQDKYGKEEVEMLISIFLNNLK